MNVKFIEYCIIEKAIVKFIEEVKFIAEVKLIIAQVVVLVLRVSSHDYGGKVLGNVRQFFTGTLMHLISCVPFSWWIFG